LGINKFERNANVVQSEDLEVLEKDFEVVTREHASMSSVVQESEEEVKRKENGKEPEEEPKNLVIDLNDNGNLNLDLAGFNYDRPKLDDVGTFGAKELEAPIQELQPSLDDKIRRSPSTITKPDMVVKKENKDFCNEHDDKKAKKREEEAKTREEERLEKETLLEENQIFMEKLSQVSIFQVPTALWHIDGDVQVEGYSSQASSQWSIALKA